MTRHGQTAELLRAHVVVLAAAIAGEDQRPRSRAEAEESVSILADLVDAADPDATTDAPAIRLDLAVRSLAERVENLGNLVQRLLDARPALARLVGADAAVALEALDELVVRLVGAVTRRMADEVLTDGLTRVLNRRAFDADVIKATTAAERRRGTVALAVVDLDGLKHVNDTEGHTAGDERLRALAQALREAVRISDSVYRIGGDEFAVVLPETTADAVETVLGRASGAGAPAFTAGVAMFPEVPANELFRAADDALLARRRHRSRSSG